MEFKPFFLVLLELCLFKSAYLLTLNKTDEYLNCPDYGDIENAKIQIIPTDNSVSFQVLHVECDIGYDLVGHPKIRCKKGIWEPVSNPKCVKRCDPPPYLERGLLQMDGEKDQYGKYSKGSLAIYSCIQDYELIPPESSFRVCEMGLWTGASAKCIPILKYGCKEPKSIQNGYFVLERSELENSYDVGQRLHYSCNSGYILVGDAVQQCLEDGSWSPKLPPICVKSDDEDRRCGSPRTSDFTSAKVVRGTMSPGGGALIGTELEVRCQRGYRDQRAPCQPALLRCIAPGVWQGALPYCIPVNSCTSPPIITNANLYNYATSTNQHYSQNENSENDNMDDEDNEVDGRSNGIPIRYPIGAEVEYKCLPGYQMRGDFILTCDNTGCWRPESLPMCYPDNHFLEEYMSTSSTVLVSLATAAGVALALLGACGVLVCRRRKSWPPNGSGSTPGTLTPADCTAAASALLHDPDRLALIAFADGVQASQQSGLPSYEEAVRDRNGGNGLLACRPHRPHWPALGNARRPRPPPSGEIGTRQGSCTSHSASVRSGSAGGGMDPMGSTDTMTPSEVSTNVTLDTVSSHTCSSGSQVASCRAMCGSLASFDTNSVLNTEGVPLLEESELEEVISTSHPGLVLDRSAPSAPAADNASFKFHRTSPDLA